MMSSTDMQQAGDNQSLNEGVVGFMIPGGSRVEVWICLGCPVTNITAGDDTPSLVAY
jgi:hypothetical protein